MPFDAFLKLSGIKGESTDAKHKDEIVVDSFSFGLSNSGSSSASGGAGVGKVAFGDFSFSTRVSGASPQLFLACASGKHIADALLTVRKAGGKDLTEFYKVTFNDVLISSYQDAGDTAGHPGTDAPVDQVSFNFAKITVTYTGENAKGGANPPLSASWDLKQNKGQ